MREQLSRNLDEFSASHNAEARSAFVNAVNRNAELIRFWSRFEDDIASPDFDASHIASDWSDVSDSIISHLNKKRAAPLDAAQLDDTTLKAAERYERHRRDLIPANATISHTNQLIQNIKGQASESDTASIDEEIAQVERVKARYTPAIATLCDAHEAELAAIAELETKREQAKDQLDEYRQAIFPAYEDGINEYLAQFGATFRIKGFRSRDTASGPTSTYSLEIKGKRIAVTRDNVASDELSFGSALSSGDRSTLAFAFFLEDLRQQQIDDLIVVVDDPVTSLDEHRWRRTVTELRKVAQRVEQLIVLSHDRQFLGKIWGQIRVPDDDRVALRIARQDDGSSLREWDVIAETMTDHDRARMLITEYVNSGNGDERDVAEALRVYLEGFLLAVFPDEYRKGTTIGKFIQVCKQRQQDNKPILSPDHIQELEELVKYTNEFHHSGNTSINAGTLTTFAQNTLDFCRMPRYYQLQC